MRRSRLAVLGGTFDHLHIGHHALLASAFAVGDEVAIGLTTDRFVAQHPKPGAGRMQGYRTRRSTLVRWLRHHYPSRKWRVVPLENPFGGSVAPEVGVLVVSRDTERGGRAVNRERRRLGRPSVPIVSVPLVLADDLEAVSSRRVRAGTIGADGRRLGPIRVALSTTDPRDRDVGKRAVAAVFPRARFVNLVADLHGLSASRTVRAHPARRASKYDLAIRVSRRRDGGWSAVERTPRVRLRSRPIRGSRPEELERGLISLLRPRP
ncbi:MAG: pantetheine-phosphate adenylyltransferase [Thermoplasmata archaeon]